ncbi:MAG: hypothetical protein RLZZ172_2191 [Bacteroidota bacterium]|jgi:hypothetical protein
MKKLFQHLTIAISTMVMLASCSKEEDREIFLGGKAPVLSASVSGTIPLGFATENNAAVKFSWTNPDYDFASGVSSQDVNYTLEIDVSGKSFNSPNKKAVSISKELSVSYTQKEFNIILSDLQLKLNAPAAVDVRIIASLGASATSLVSNVMKFNVTPFAPPPKVPVPTAGTLWIIGDAVASSWNNPLPSPFDATQKFTKVSETLYELVANFVGGGAYKLIQENGVWGTQYHMVEGNANGGTFEKKDADPAFVGPTAGRYKISVDFQTGKFTVTKQ